MKHCTKCGKEKDTNEFNKRAKSHDSLTARCKKCLATWYKTWSKSKGPRRNLKSDLKRRYKMTPEEYDELLKTQGDVCAVCGTNKPEGRGRWHVDHDHLTGLNRGLLCHHCNVGLGHFFDDPQLLRKAAAYLER